MKKVSTFLISLILIIMIAAFCGCDVSFVKNGDNVIPGTSDSTALTETTAQDAENPSNTSSSSSSSPSSIFDSGADTKKTGGINKDRINHSNENEARTEEEILASDKYIVKGRIETGGSVTPYYIARSGQKMSLLTEMNGVRLGLISTESAMYVISPTKKTYSDVPDLLKKSLKTELEKAASQGDRTLVSEGTQVVDGVTLNYKKYSDKSVDYSYKGILVKQISYNDGKEVILYVDEVSTDVSNSDFAPPSAFKRVSITEFASALK